MKANIKSTSDYSLLKVGDYQPESRLAPTAKLVDSLKITNGNLNNPGIVDRESQTLMDGNRRYKACELADVPFYYTEFSESGDLSSRDFTKMLNTTGKQWTIKDYLSSYGKHNSEYSVLLTYLLERQVPTAILASFLYINSTQLKAEVKLNIDYEVLDKKVDVYFAIKGMYPNVAKNHIHRSLGKLYQLSEFDDVRLIHKLTTMFDNGQLKNDFLGKNFFLKILCDSYDFKVRDNNKAHLHHQLVLIGKA